MTNYYLLLVAAIVAEIVATTALKMSDGFTKLLPSLVSVLGYGLAFYSLSFVLRVLPVGITYAVWSGIGTLAIALIGLFYFGQKIQPMAVVGMVLVVVGVIFINLFSNDYSH